MNNYDNDSAQTIAGKVLNFYNLLDEGKKREFITAYNTNSVGIIQHVLAQPPVAAAPVLALASAAGPAPAENPYIVTYNQILAEKGSASAEKYKELINTGKWTDADARTEAAKFAKSKDDVVIEGGGARKRKQSRRRKNKSRSRKNQRKTRQRS